MDRLAGDGGQARVIDTMPEFVTVRPEGGWRLI
jgi:hypothetical protein